MQNQSLKYEFEFIHYLNNKAFNELSEKWKKHIKRMFPDVKDDTMIYCSKHENYFAKGDIDIRIKGSKKIVSLKNGRNACMHRERFKWIYKTLKDAGVSFNTLNVITLYQFGESKIFGHQDQPLTKEEIVDKYGHLIQKANEELNDDQILDLIINRAIIQGGQEYRQKIDYLYYGNLEKGILVSVEQIYASIKSRKSISSSWIQFGQLVFQPGARNRRTNDYLETTIRWPVLSKLFYITKDEDNILECDIENQI